MKKIPLIHGKFRAKNNPMKFHFAVFMGHEMIFMGFLREIHGIFIKLQFIVHIITNDPIRLSATDVIPTSIVSDLDAPFACINVHVNWYQLCYK